MTLYSKILRLVLSVAAFLGLCIGVIFWPEISQSFTSQDGGQSGDTLGRLGSNSLPVDQTDQIREFVLGDQKSKTPAARVINQRLKNRQSDEITVAVDLQSTSWSTAYPSLRVTMLDNTNKVLRTFTVSNAEYLHGRSLTQETILFKFKTLPDEAHLRVKPFYPEL